MLDERAKRMPVGDDAVPNYPLRSMEDTLLLLESVPNISEGRDPALVEMIARAATDSDGVTLLHLDRGYSAHRSVFTLAGEPNALADGLFRLISEAVARIDLRHQAGPHPRIGAADVVPLVPLRAADVDIAQQVVQKLAARVADALQLPVYLYAQSARQTNRRLLADIRRGGFENLAAKMRLPAWQPDFGPSHPHPSAGACVIGVRPIMIAYNVNLAGSNALKAARALAKRIRENSSASDQVNRFPGLRAIGWFMPQFGCAQVSMNITDPSAAPLHTVYTRLEELAPEYGARVDGSEMIGLVPYRVLEAAGKAFSSTEPGKTLIERAVDGLGLNRVKPFEPNHHILENALGFDPLPIV